MNYTSLEQSKRLVELGLSPESADMYYQYVLPNSDKIKHVPEIGDPLNALEWYNKGYTSSGKDPITLNEFCIPCWSVGALLEAMPKQIFSEDRIKHYVPTLYIVERASIGYQAMNEFLCIEDGKTLIEAAYNMVVWLLENGYIKKG